MLVLTSDENAIENCRDSPLKKQHVMYDCKNICCEMSSIKPPVTTTAIIMVANEHLRCKK